VGASAAESPIRIEINGRRHIAWTGTALDLEELVLGRLLTEGYITARSDLLHLEVRTDAPGCFGVSVRVPEANVARVMAEQRHQRDRGCGLLHFVHCKPWPQVAVANAHPDAALMRAGFRALFAATDAAYPAGGMHAAVLWSDAKPQEPVFDVGRHNTIDRAIGRALVAGTPLGGAGLLLSARVSGAIALKAARAGLAFLASRSIPTTLALEIAGAAGLLIIERAGARAEPTES
jgi:FdhD protein